MQVGCYFSATLGFACWRFEHQASMSKAGNDSHLEDIADIEAEASSFGRLQDEFQEVATNNYINMLFNFRIGA